MHSVGLAGSRALATLFYAVQHAGSACGRTNDSYVIGCRGDDADSRPNDAPYDSTTVQLHRIIGLYAISYIDKDILFNKGHCLSGLAYTTWLADSIHNNEN